MDDEVVTIEEQELEPVEPKKVTEHKWRKRVLRTFAVFFILVVALPSILYIPAVQRAAKNYIETNVSASTGYTIRVGKLSLKFPLRLSVSDVTVLDEHRDTMICGRLVDVNVRPLALLSGNVAITGIEVDNAYYRMVSSDTSMVLKARLKNFQLSQSRYGLLSDHIDLGEAMVDGVDATIDFDNRKAKQEPKDTSASTPLLVTLDRLKLSDVRYRMTMMPTIQNLDAKIDSGELEDLTVNMGTNLVRLVNAEICRLDAKYYQPTEKAAAAFTAQLPVDTVQQTDDSKPWTIVARHVRLADSRALYAVSGTSPTRGFDTNYLQLDSVNIAVKEFYNRGSIMRVPLTELSAVERSGLKIASTSGLFTMDDNKVSIENFKVATPKSSFGIDAWADASALSGDDDAKLEANITSKISLADAGLVVPVLKPLFKQLGNRDVNLAVDAGGTMRSVKINKVTVGIPDILNLSMKGNFANLMKPEYINGAVDIDGKLTGGSYVKRALDLPSDINVPVVALKGRVDYKDEKASGNIRATVGGGHVVADGQINMRRESYDADLKLSDFNVMSVLPTAGVGTVTGDVTVDGRGYDLYKMKTTALADISNVTYDGVTYHDISLSAELDNGYCDVALTSDDEKAMLGLNLTGELSPDEYKMRFDGRIDNLDLVAMNMATERLSGGMDVQGAGLVNLKKEEYAGFMRLSNMFLILPGNTFRTDSIDLGFKSSPDHTGLRLRNNDMKLAFESPVGVMSLVDSITNVMPLIDSMIVAQRLNLTRLNQQLPHFTASFTSQDRNIVQTYLSGMGASYGELNIDFAKQDELSLKATLRKLDVSEVQFDEITMYGQTQNDSLIYSLGINNNPDNSEYLRTGLIEGSVSANRAKMFVTQIDKNGETGFKFGLNAELADSIATLSIYPENPRIAFSDWTVNSGNYVSYDLNKNLFRADMTVRSGDNCLINIYTDRDGLFHNGVNVELAGIELHDWLVLSPFSPPIEGRLAGTAKINFNQKYYWGNCCMKIDNMTYGKKEVGNVDLDAKLAMTDDAKKAFALAQLQLDGEEIMTLKGVVKDTLPTTDYDLNLSLKKLPLSRASAFLPEGTGEMSGFLNGTIMVKGSIDDPSINGYIQFDSAQVRLPNYGSALNFDTRQIPVNNGCITFDDYALRGANGNAITVNGHVDLSMNVDKIYTDLKLKGKNVQVVNGKKQGKVELYGKGFIDLNGAVKGYVNNLDMRASVSILAGTNLTYVYQSSTIALTESSDEGVVTFVNLNDTTTNGADSLATRPYIMRIKAALIIQPNAIFNVNLSTDGKNKIQFDGEGMLSYSQNDQGDASLIGRYAISSGFVRYSPPMMSEKNFKFDEGSTVIWNGELLNPSLSLKAVQSMKVNVTSSSQGSRSVPFDVVLNVGGTLNSLAVTFDLETDGDMTIANELSGMTDEQRATQAMNLLLYNTYTGTGSTASNPAGELSGNMAFSFLESVVNKWAASNISGVDLSFGIDQEDHVTSSGSVSKSMNYSYKVSKSVFDDRFKIAVGGNYTSDASAEDNLAQNLLNDLSFEYKLNKTGTSNVKLFYRKEYESILEGEITEYGAGFMWKRKINSIGDMFKFLKVWQRKKRKTEDTKKE